MCVEVTAAVAVRDGRVLIARRSPGKREAGKWEFPGGKKERGESLRASLGREIREELGVEALVGRELLRSRYNYPHGCIDLIAFQVDFSGEPRAMTDHDRIEWVELNRLTEYDLAPADLPVAEYLVRG